METKKTWKQGKGKWKLDERAQFLTISKESFGGWLGKKIWACNLVDYYYLEGTIRGWTPLEAATVKGQWQAKRLGCTDEERGPAPWFEDEGDEELTAAEGAEEVMGAGQAKGVKGARSKNGAIMGNNKNTSNNKGG